jgi:hypothetical protein
MREQIKRLDKFQASRGGKLIQKKNTNEQKFRDSEPEQIARNLNKSRQETTQWREDFR